MQLMHVKLRNHEDVLTYIERSENDSKLLVFTHPIAVFLDPDRGFYAKHWLVFSENNFVKLPQNEVLFINKASDYAKNYYEEFFRRNNSSRLEDEYDEDDLEEMYNSMIESKDAIKH